MIFAFADHELDVALYQLRTCGEPVKLAPRAFDLLLYLIQHRDRVVEKSELLEEVWRGEHVTEAVLPSTVAAIRRALEDGRPSQALVETVHGRGYRFVAPVDERERADPSEPTGLFVGREGPMRVLWDELGEVVSGRGRMLMLVGEPGIGKTRTAEELGKEARRRGALVAEGRCDEGEGVPAFWPWVQILRRLVAELPDAGLRDQLGVGASDFAPLLPELRVRFPDLPEAIALDSEQARFRFFDSVSIFLSNVSRIRPLVLVLDDLHWADEPSLRLLHFLVRGMRDVRLAVVGTYRDVELRRHHPLSQILGLLSKEPHYRRIQLAGLTERDVGRFIASRTERAPAEALVRAVFQMTEGNPFFVSETVRLLEAEGRLEEAAPEASWNLSLPEGVREVIGRRLDRLSADCNRVLRVAAVMSREFSVGILQQITQLSHDSLLAVLDEAVTAGIVCSPSGTEAGAAPLLPLGHYAFSHALIRESLREELTNVERVRLHRRIAEALEESYGRAAGSHLPELAHHFFEAAPGGDVERAIDYCVRAGRQALELLAWEEAVAHYDRALQAEELLIPSDDARRGELTLGLGEALWRAGSYARARQAFREANDLARRLGDGRLMARAVLGMGGWPQFRFDEPPGGRADEYYVLVEEALERLEEGETALRARLTSRLADQTSMALRRLHSERAVELARESGDADALFSALYARSTALLGPGDAHRRSEVASELLDLGVRSRSKEAAFVARESRIRSFLGLGEIAKADREIEACEQLAGELRLPIYWHSVSRFQLARALGDGRFDEAERLNARVLELGREADDAGADFLFGLLEGWIAHSRGDESGTRVLIEGFRGHAPFPGRIASSFVAFLHAELGELEPARHQLESLAAAGFEELPRDENWLITQAFSAEACAALHDAERAAALYDLLLPYANQTVSHLHLRVYLGPVESVLAGLATACDARARAAMHYEAALEACLRMGARPSLARTEYEFARMLTERAGVSFDARRRSRELLASSERNARELGMKRLLERVQSLH